jgi:autophagy-related protein 2
VYPQHFQAKPILEGGKQLNAAKLAGTHVSPPIGLRFIIKDASILCRFFDGLDWTQKLPPKKLTTDGNDRRRVLLNGLLNGEDTSSGNSLMLLPDERSETLIRDSNQKGMRRNVHRYFSISISGLKMSQDSYVTSVDYQLASCLDLSLADFFVAETISSKDPVKMIGEWINDEHPRDDSDGVIMLKMITSHPALRVSADGKLMSDESQATLELLPLRCFFHQAAIRFMRSFFAGEESNTKSEDDEIDGDEIDGLNSDADDLEIIPVFFTSFKVYPAKLKVDYTPEKMDVDSFRSGNYVEILNLCPLEDMVLTLQAVENHDLTGWGSVFGELASRWIEDVGKTQSHKFFTRATPVQFFSGITEGAADLAMVLVVPESGNLADYLKDVLYSSISFTSKLACETLTTSAKLTRYAANQLNTKDLLPRPKTVPRHVGDSVGHGYESINRGLREANYKIVTVPLREYQQSGASGAARSAVRGLPIALMAPLSGEVMILLNDN